MMTNLTNDEKHDMILFLMRDLRSDWGNDPSHRANILLELARELNYKHIINAAEGYIRASEEYNNWDGRYFRDSWADGGYEEGEFKSESLSNNLLRAMEELLSDIDICIDVYLDYVEGKR